jgi:hypothetical protein
MPKNFKLLKVKSSKFKELLAFSFLATQITRESNPAILSGASLIFCLFSISVNVLPLQAFFSF